MTELRAEKARGTLGKGRAHLSVERGSCGSILAERYFTDPYRLFTPRTEPGEPLSLVLSTLSGGLVGGDSLSLEAQVQTGAAAQLVGQAAEKVYRSVGPTATATIDLKAGADAWVELVPQETILFKGSRFERSIRISLEASARALIGDMVVFGRLAMGESFDEGHFQDTWQLKINDRLRWFDRFGLSDENLAERRENAFGLAKARAMATILCVGPGAADAVLGLKDEDRVAHFANLGLRLSATDLGTHGLIRLLGEEPHVLRKELGVIWAELRHSIGGFKPVLPKLWSI